MSWEGGRTNCSKRGGISACSSWIANLAVVSLTKLATPSVSHAFHGSACLEVGSYHVNATAGAYSQTSGVFAGFAFFAIIYLLTTNAPPLPDPPNRIRAFARRLADKRKRSETDRALFALFCAAFGLAVTSLQYAILSGETGVGLLYGRSASEELMADISLSSAIFTLSYGLILLIEADSFGRTNRLVRAIASIGGPPLATYFIAGTAIDIAVARWASRSGLTLCGSNHFYSEINTWATLAPIAVLACTASAWLVPRVLPTSARRTLWRETQRLSNVPPVASLVMVFLAAAAGSTLNIYEPLSRWTEADVWIALVLASGLLTFQGVFIRFSAAH